MAETAVVSREEWLKYLEEQVNKTIYVWGANDELVINILPKLANMEKSDHTYEQALNNTDRALTLLHKRLLTGCDILKIRAADCSGLAIRFLLEHHIISSDMNANAIWEMLTEKGRGKQIKLSEVKAGDYLFNGNDDNKWHIGYSISNQYAIESQDHDKGVVQTKISERPWKYAARPNWYEDETVILTRVLRLTDPYMRGEDVRAVQERLNELGYNCGEADGIFGKNTDIASKNFKHDAGLRNETGAVGKKTAEALGFKWAG